MAGGETRFDDLTLSRRGAHPHQVIEPNDSRQFRGNSGDVTFDFTDKLYMVTPVAGYRLLRISASSFAHQDQTGDEDICVSRRSAIRSAVGLRENRWEQRLTDKGFDDDPSAMVNVGPDRFTLDGLAGEDVIVSPASDRDYLVTPTIDEDLIRDFTDANLTGSLFVLDEEGTLADRGAFDYTLDEDSCRPNQTTPPSNEVDSFGQRLALVLR